MLLYNIVMLYNVSHVMLHNKCHITYITYVTLYNISHVMLYNMSRES